MTTKPPIMPVSTSMRTATRNAIERIAYLTARDAKGQRKADAQAHCRRLGITPPA